MLEKLRKIFKTRTFEYSFCTFVTFQAIIMIHFSEIIRASTVSLAAGIIFEISIWIFALFYFIVVGK